MGSALGKHLKMICALITINFPQMCRMLNPLHLFTTYVKWPCISRMLKSKPHKRSRYIYSLEAGKGNKTSSRPIQYFSPVHCSRKLHGKVNYLIKQVFFLLLVIFSILKNSRQLIFNIRRMIRKFSSCQTSL